MSSFVEMRLRMFWLEADDQSVLQEGSSNRSAKVVSRKVCMSAALMFCTAGSVCVIPNSAKNALATPCRLAGVGVSKYSVSGFTSVLTPANR